MISKLKLKLFKLLPKSVVDDDSLSIRNPIILDFLVLLLVMIGFLNVLSSSTNRLIYNFSQSFDGNLGLKHLVFVAVGLMIYFLLPRLMNSAFLLRWRIGFYGICLLLLVLIFTPLGIEVNGSRRWIAMGFFNLQPAELTRLALVVFFAGFFANKKIDDLQQLPIFILACFFLFLPVGLISLQTDLSSSVVIVFVVFALFLLAGFRWLFLVLATMAGGLVFLGLVMVMSDRMARFAPIFAPWKHQLGSGFQSMQAFIAQDLGGSFGQGYGHSQQKIGSLPEAYNDFAITIFFEEWGILGVFILIVLFSLLTAYIFVVSYACFEKRRDFSGFICAGIGFTIFFQCFFNIGVNIGVMPSTGLNLPLLSYGGTNLISNLISLALVRMIAQELDLPDQALFRHHARFKLKNNPLRR